MLTFVGLTCCAPQAEKKVHITLLDPQTVTICPDVCEHILEGTGRMLFQPPLFGLYSKELYLIEASWPKKDSKVILHSHFKGFIPTLPCDGIQVLLLRENQDLVIKASSPGHKAQTLTVKENYFTSSPRLTLYVLAQNGGADNISLKIWDAKATNPKQNNTETTTKVNFYAGSTSPLLLPQNLIADSSKANFHSKGEGILWGVELIKARLIQAERKSINQW